MYIIYIIYINIYIHTYIYYKYIYIYTYIYIYIYIYIYAYMVCSTERFIELAIRSWSEWNLNPRPLISVQKL